jgi:hypothetical protein
MSVFSDMYPLRVIASHRDFQEIERMLSEAMDRGYVREVVVSRELPPNHLYSHVPERWFLDPESGEAYSLTVPRERSSGYRERLDLDSIQPPSCEIQ